MIRLLSRRCVMSNQVDGRRLNERKQCAIIVDSFNKTHLICGSPTESAPIIRRFGAAHVQYVHAPCPSR